LKRSSSLYLLDTDVLIFILRGLKRACSVPETVSKARQVRERIQRVQKAGMTVGVSAITVSELEYGAAKSSNPSRERDAVRKILAPFELFSFDALAVPCYYGRIRHDLERTGVRIGAMDLLIAAHAHSLGAVLVSNNVREFSRVTGLTCENWAE
jgi:tRNA(fMet)-specific endonuclease VapC